MAIGLAADHAAQLAAALPRIDAMIVELASFQGTPTTISLAREFGPFQYEVNFLRQEICGFLEGRSPQSRPADGRRLSDVQQVDHFLWVTQVYEEEVAKWRQMVAAKNGRAQNA